jgi:riboflavin biosynthesis pyrimidine reductase
VASDAELADLYAYPDAGSWVRANMVASADGAATLQGRSGGLSGAADHQIFSLLRSLADVIIVGAQTVRAEGYGPAKANKDWAHLRAGRPPTPPIAVVTRNIDLDLSSRLFTEAPHHARTIVITTEAAPEQRRAQAARSADVIIAGRVLADLETVITLLARRGLRRILTEGGPRLLGELAATGLLDELCLTVSPLLVSGDASRITSYATLAPPRPMRLAHVFEADGSLLCRYLRAYDVTHKSQVAQEAEHGLTDDVRARM